MKCHWCGKDDDRVIDSRPSFSGTAIRRRRECRACGQRFTTLERVSVPPTNAERLGWNLAELVAEAARGGRK